jgi:hypothetical protein
MWTAFIKSRPNFEFNNAHGVVDAFYEAYPHVEIDPYFSEFVVGIARRAGFEFS